MTVSAREVAGYVSNSATQVLLPPDHYYIGGTGFSGRSDTAVSVGRVTGMSKIHKAVYRPTDRQI